MHGDIRLRNYEIMRHILRCNELTKKEATIKSVLILHPFFLNEKNRILYIFMYIILQSLWFNITVMIYYSLVLVLDDLLLKLYNENLWKYCLMISYGQSILIIY